MMDEIREGWEEDERNRGERGKSSLKQIRSASQYNQRKSVWRSLLEDWRRVIGGGIMNLVAICPLVSCRCMYFFELFLLCNNFSSSSPPLLIPLPIRCLLRLPLLPVCCLDGVVQFWIWLCLRFEMYMIPLGLLLFLLVRNLLQPTKKTATTV